jgi:hypothetical protein
MIQSAASEARPLLAGAVLAQSGPSLREDLLRDGARFDIRPVSNHHTRRSGSMSTMIMPSLSGKVHTHVSSSLMVRRRFPSQPI